jgi:hypothetical protein
VILTNICGLLKELELYQRWLSVISFCCLSLCFLFSTKAEFWEVHIFFEDRFRSLKNCVDKKVGNKIKLRLPSIQLLKLIYYKCLRFVNFQLFLLTKFHRKKGNLSVKKIPTCPNLSLVAHRFGRFEFGIFVLIFLTVPAWKKQ